jgi:hypothetical protein
LNTSVVAAVKKAAEISSTGAQDLIRDRIHPGPAGQLLMAEALLKAWNAPPVVASVELDTASAKIVKEENTKLDNLQVNGTISWTQHDLALPMPIDLKNSGIELAVKASDVEQALNQETLKVQGALASKYALKIDGEDITDVTREQLAAGINLAELDTPMSRQARSVHNLTLQHNNLHFQRWRTIQVPNERRGYPGLAKAIEGLDILEADMVAEQRAKAKPLPHRFELVPRS